MEEITLTCCDGIKIAGQKWVSKPPARQNNPYSMTMGNPYGGGMMMNNPYGGTTSTGNASASPITKRILCIHGWMDNCRSYWYLAPNLVERLSKSLNESNPYVGNASAPTTIECVAIDLPGHGKSDIKSLDGPPAIYLEYVFYIGEVLKQLNWTEEGSKVTLIGHSLGASQCMAYAACFPEHVEKLVLLERGKPKSMAVKNTVKYLRDHVQTRQSNASLSQTKRFLYDTLDQAIESRVNGSKLHTGKQTISRKAAEELVKRGTRSIAGGYQFCHDFRLEWPLMIEMVEEQVDMYVKGVKCPAIKLLGETGWPFSEEALLKEAQMLNYVVNKVLPGSHHHHADPETAKAVLDEIVKFLT